MAEITELNQNFEPITEQPTLEPLDLNRELTLSGLDAKQLDILQRHSAGVMSLYDFSNRWHREQTEAPPGVKRGYGLGITSDRELYGAACNAYDLFHWNEGFPHHGIPLSGEFVPKYLDTITNTDKPIVFFVPKKVLSDDSANRTKEEMEWYLENAEKGSTRTTQFVFGLYSCMDIQTYLTALPQSLEKRKGVLTRMLKLPQEYQG